MKKKQYVRKHEKKSPASLPKKQRYISFNFDELAELRKLPLRERWLYLELKAIANFRTGIGGRFGLQRVTYERLAALVVVPASQGRAAEAIDRSAAWRLMQRLEAAGLVADIGEREDNGGLTFVLPLSPIEPREKLQQSGPIEPGKLQRAGTPELPESRESVRTYDDWVEPSSVMINQKNINTPEGANESPGGAGAAGILATSPPEDPSPVPRALTLFAIEGRLTTGEFDYVHSDKSRNFYRRWIKKKVTPKEFERAVKSVEENLEFRQTPDSVDEELVKGRLRRRNGFGRVAL